MAGLLPRDSLNHRRVENRLYDFSHEGEELGHSGCGWYFSRKQIEENSPSRRDNIDLKKETYLRKSYCTFLQELGMKLKVPPVTIATAIIFCHQFFLRQSHARNDRRTIATVCMFLAGKVEETPHPLRDVVIVSYEILHKKDPFASQNIKQKEVYEQQKELLVLGERVVLATLGFDLNVHHPYKPLVEAIKKFKVAQSALAKVAWNFVNDGLRTSLCLQYKPHQIAAGAIFLAAKFLKVKLPSDGDKVWWQEFAVTPRQLEDVSNQMLELYDQNHPVKAFNGSEVDGSSSSMTAHHPPGKMVAVNKETMSTKCHSQAFGVANVKHGGPMPSHARSFAEQSTSDNLNQSQRTMPNQSNDCGSTDTKSGVWQHDTDGEGKDYRPLFCRESTVEASSKSKSQMDLSVGVVEINKKVAAIETGKRKNEDLLHKSTSTGNQNSGRRETLKGYYLLDVIGKIDKDEVKAALERRKLCGDIIENTDLMDEDDLIKKELEDGVEVAVVGEKRKHETRDSCLRPSSRQGTNDHNFAKKQDGIGDKICLLVSEEQCLRGEMNSWSSDSENGVILDHDPSSETVRGKLSPFDGQGSNSRVPKPRQESCGHWQSEGMS